MHSSWRRLGATIGLTAIAVWWQASPARAEDTLALSGGAMRLDSVLPRAVLDDIKVPPAPIRVAIKPKLDWRPGLRESAEQPPSGRTDNAKPPKLPEQLSNAGQPLVPEAEEGDPVAESAKDADSSPEEGPRLKPAKPAEPDAPAVEDNAPETDRQPPKAAPKAARSNPSASREPKLLTSDARRGAKPVAGTPAEASEEATASPRDTESEEPKPAAEPKAPPAPLTRGLRNLRSRLRTTLSHYYRLPLNSGEHDPWEIMHSMLSYELQSRVRVGGPRGQMITAVGHLCFNRPCKGQRLMRVGASGGLDAPIGVGLQGHKGQFLAMLAQCNVSPDYPIRVDGKEFTIHDLIRAEQKTCYAGEELTFKLIALGHYLESDATWLNDRGESWSIPRLIEEERKQPIRGAACGGTHRLAGLGLAVRRREARSEPIDGAYLEAADFVKEYHNYAWRLQNRDGSMSTEWFRGPGDEEDLERRIRTTGHTVEWLVYSVADEDLRSSRLVRAVNYLTNLLAHNSDKEWHLGSIGHAVHALVLYDKRVFQPLDSQEALELAAVDPSSRLFRGYRIYRGVLRKTPPESSGFLGLFGNSRTTRRR
ncbi:MAG: hypothetical protein AAFV43_13845 [Planctomycetota bacterium]